MAFKIKNFYQQTSSLRQQKTSPLRQHEEGHGYTYQANPTVQEEIYLPNGQLKGTLYTDGTFMKSDWVLQKEAEDKDTTPANEAMTPYISEEEAIESGQTFGGEGFTDAGEGTVWVYDSRGQRVKKLSDEENERLRSRQNDQMDRYLNTGKALDPRYEFEGTRNEDGSYDGVYKKIDFDISNPDGYKDFLARTGNQEKLEAMEKMKIKKDPSKVNWSEAPPLNTQARTQWYIDNDLGLDKTTPPLTVAETEPEPIEEVMTSSVPKARNNRRTRRADRIKERNIQAELRNKGIKGNAKEGLIDGSFTIDDQDFQDPTVA